MNAQRRRTSAEWIASRRAWLGWGVVVLAAFVLIYGGCNWLTGLRSARVRLDFAFERRIPLVPATALVYLSLNPLMWCSGWVLDRPRQWRALAWTMIAAIGVGGVGFLLLPADLAYTPWRETAPPAWHGVLTFVDRLVGRHNLFPSLHVALGWICAAAYVCSGPPQLRPLWIAWAAAIFAATLFAHQHHLVDVLGGIAVGWLCVRLVYRRLLPETARAAQTSAPSASLDRALPV